MKLKELKYSNNERIETRVYDVISYIFSKHSNPKIYLSEIDATGKLGNELKQRVSQKDRLLVTSDVILKLFKESGQILEGVIEIIPEKKGNPIIIDLKGGMYVDIYENNLVIPNEVLGEHRVVEY